nr:MAG: hypothetical protein [Microviridae sp.]
MKTIIYDQFTTPPVLIPEVNKEPSMVETAGYISSQQQIENLINAGQRLDDYRKMQYDSDQEGYDEDTSFDVTRSANFDMADASQLSLNLKAKKKAFDEEQKILEAERLKSLAENTPVYGAKSAEKAEQK